MQQHKGNLKSAAYISFGVFVLMLCGAIYYYKQRMLFADASHIAFSAINEQALQIQQYRFGSFITQMVPVIGAKLGLSLKAIIIAYSASFNVFYLLVAAVLLFGFRAYRFVVLYAMYWVLVTTHAFFWPNNEVHQGIAYMFLLFPALLATGEKKYNFSIPVILLLVVGTTAIFCHPLVLPPFIFLWVYLIAEKTHWPFNKRQTAILSILAMIIVLAKLYVSSKYAGYDSGLLTGVKNLQPVDIIKTFSSPFAKEVYRHVPINYWILPIVIAAGIITLFIKKKFFLAVWTLGCTLVYFILLCLTFGGYIEFGSEAEIMAGIIIAVAPFVFETLPSIRKEVAIVIVLLIFIQRYKKFHDGSSHFSERVKCLTEINEKMKSRGLTRLVLVKKEAYGEWRWMVEWGFATESMLLSALNGEKPVRQFIVMTPDELQKRLPGKKTDVIVCFETWPVEKLDPRYFPIDTSRPYTVLSYEEFIK
jgi:hypothetical protein